MNRSIAAAILLMLSLEAALAVSGHPSTATTTIRLPSDSKGFAVDQVAKKTGLQERPWKCCDMPLDIDGVNRCLDRVEHCDDACVNCSWAQDNPELYVCKDAYRGDPMPWCTEVGAHRGHARHGN